LKVQSLIRKNNMSISQDLFNKSKEEGKEEPSFLQLGVKQAGGGVESTGAHKLKFISDKKTKGRDYHTQEERDEVEYVFEEKGIEKKYRVPCYNQGGGIHYFIKNMAEVKEGESIILEMKRTVSSTGKAINVIDFKRPTSEKEEPEINLDDIEL